MRDRWHGRIVTGSLLCLLGLEAQPLPAQDRDIESSDEQIQVDAHVKIAVLPRFPSDLLEERVSGEATIAFTISEFGDARDIRVVESRPRAEFGREASDVIRHWLFNPSRVGCIRVSQHAEQRFVFNAADAERPVAIDALVVESVASELALDYRGVDDFATELERSDDAQVQRRAAAIARHDASVDADPVLAEGEAPKYPMKALRRGVEGYVSVLLQVDDEGLVLDAEVIDVNPRGYGFERASLQAARKWRFRPRKAAGRPLAGSACRTVDFRIQD